jgi:Holliday junction resolvase
MRRAARIDENHTAVVEALRSFGCSVQSLAAIGKGCPDILCGRRLVNILFEIKDGSKVESRRQLTEDEEKWAQRWRGQLVTVYSPQEAIEIMRRV